MIEPATDVFVKRHGNAPRAARLGLGLLYGLPAVLVLLLMLFLLTRATPPGVTRILAPKRNNP